MTTETNPLREMTTTSKGTTCIRCQVKDWAGLAEGKKIVKVGRFSKIDAHGAVTHHSMRALVLKTGKVYEYTHETGYVADHTDYQDDDFVVTKREKILCQNVYEWKVIEETELDK